MYWVKVITVVSFLSVFVLINCEIRSSSSRSHDSRQRDLFQDNRRRQQAFNPFHINPRQSRFLSLFTYVQFRNQECMGATGENGTCLTAPECAQRGGTSNGPCAGGFGTCCMFLAGCGATIRENGTYFVHNGYPNQFDGTGSCQVTLMKSNPDVCQYRLDFDQFTIMGPDTQSHVCNNDQFMVSGGNAIPPICGTNIGNHMYIDAGSGVTNPVTLSVITSGPSYPRNWKIRVSQIPCSSIYRAEEGCLQYFTGVAGQIRSYNYDPNTGLQLSNQDYSICIRNERNFCGVQYMQCVDPVRNISQSFTLTGNSNTQVQSQLGNNCQNDFLIIPNSVSAIQATSGVTLPVTTFDRICGGTFAGGNPTIISSPVRSNVKPFRLWFHTDNVEFPADVGNRGFCLTYVQQPCT